MKSYSSLANILSLIGALTMVLGTIFLLQSKSVIGPTASFMYRNPEWTVNGYVTILIGTLLLGIGLFLNVTSRLTKNR
jgi:uncharacterized membrane protein YczE